ncbi:MAG: TatD family hydrolase [Anaerolineaceae bacterium]|jgi:TatD DNase family protein|nr:TatD family hydrolase [Anaerolineaceae bacterium]MDD4043007.1 TatD family hydrolase [Anaerolineaceae bacterium]MDD4578270.1 TatD family hydrolase [Anaerolineaceae bacterium]
MFFDSHAHLDFDAFDADREAVIQRAKDNGLLFIINIAIDLAGTRNSIGLAKDYPEYIFATAGIHPNYSADLVEAQFTDLEKLARAPEVVAIGEIGLDYYRDHATPQQQRVALEKQLDLARRLALPIVVHERASAHELVSILLGWHQNLPSNSRLKQNPGVMHAYSADQSFVEPLLDCGFCFGIGGPVTYKNATEKRALVSSLPLDKILLETDCPFMPPQKHRGQRNEPAFIPLIAQKIAEIKGLTLEDVGSQLTSNAMRVFQLD